MSENQHQTLVDQVQESTAKTNERLSTDFASVLNATQAIQTDTTTIKRKFDETVDTVSANTELVHNSILQANSNILKMDQGMRRGAKQNAKRQRQFARQQADCNLRLFEGLDRMQAMLSTIMGSQTQTGTAYPSNSTNAAEDMGVIVLPLILMKSTLLEVIGILEAKREVFLSKEEVQLIQSEIDEVLAAAHEASAATLRRNHSSGASEPSAYLGQLENTHTRKPHQSYELGHIPLSAHQPRRKAAWKHFIHSTFAGMLIIRTQREPEVSSFASSASTTFIPKIGLQKTGVSVILSKELKAVMNPSISRCIRTFNVVSFYHSAYPANQAMYDDNVLELQRTLSAKDISLLDRDKNGSNLLAVNMSISVASKC